MNGPAQVSQPAAKVAEAEVEAMIAGIGSIPGVDVAAAISRMMGRRDLYASLARRIAIERADRGVEIREALCAHDDSALAGLIHEAKSLLGALGAEEMQQRCIDLQRSLRAGERHAADLTAFAVDYADLLAHLKAIAQSVPHRCSSEQSG